MQVSKLSDFTKGWVVGNFNPSLIKTNDVEFAVKRSNKGDHEDMHYHKIATEVTVVVTGHIKMGGREFFAGDVIVTEPNEAIEFDCLEDNTNCAVIKYPGANNDKYLGRPS